MTWRGGTVPGWLTAVVAVALVAGCSTGDTDVRRPEAGRSSPPASGTTTAPSQDLTRFYSQQASWRDCKGGMECTDVEVPVDYAEPGGATLRIAVNRRPASGDRIGSLLLNPGGPGASGLEYARAAESVVTAAVRERYDVVGFDPRGVGASAGLQCLGDRELDAFIAFDGTPDNPAEEQGLLEQGRKLGAGCAADNAALLAHVATVDAARDLDVLRAVLGDEQLTYLGKSYGTFLGATYAGLFPERAGRLVLDGPLDPTSSSLEVAQLQAVGFERALGAFLDDCLTRSGCPFSGDRGSAQERLRELLDGIDPRPLPGAGGREVTQSMAVLGVAVALYDEGSWPFLRDALSAAFDGDGRTLNLLSDFYADRGPGGRYTSNANEAIYAVNCLDRPAEGDAEQFRADAAAAAEVAPLFGPYIVWSNFPCVAWPVPPTGEVGPITAAGSAPILVVGTTRDPATPYEWAKALSSQLEAGELLTYIGDGHTAYQRGSRCIDDAVDEFLLEGTVPAAGTRCR